MNLEIRSIIAIFMAILAVALFGISLIVKKLSKREQIGTKMTKNEMPFVL